MKKYILLSILLMTYMVVICQTNYTPTPEYEYAMLRIIDQDVSYRMDRKNPSYIVQYSNTGEEVRLKDTLKIDREKENLTEVKFKCFQYVNRQGYELVTGTCYAYNTGMGGVKEKYEYVFKRLKQPGGK